MPEKIAILAVTAATVGFLHTILGPDHYIPFIAMSKAGRWSGVKTAVITVLCGFAHVLSSVLLGLIGIALGIAVFRLEAVESFRGELAAWLLIAFGFTYFVWGMHKSTKASHEHAHPQDSMTPWVLFTIFVFGPCEPLIPLVMYPAAVHSVSGVLIVTAVFGIVTIATMSCIVMASFLGMSRLPLGMFEKYSHASAGLAIFFCGIAVKFLGL